MRRFEGLTSKVKQQAFRAVLFWTPIVVKLMG
jgi:hypothetical protein